MQAAELRGLGVNSTDRLLDEIKDPNGQVLRFFKEIDGNISRIVMPKGKEINIS